LNGALKNAGAGQREGKRVFSGGGRHSEMEITKFRQHSRIVNTGSPQVVNQPGILFEVPVAAFPKAAGRRFSALA
jgi:hypothetical protein